MAAGVNYNGIWAGLASRLAFRRPQERLCDCRLRRAGIVWAVGSKVKRWKVGDEVVIHCNQDDGDDEECNGGDPMFSPASVSGAMRPWTALSPSSAAFRPASSCRGPST
jgi:crotonyl-CoA carboxylase/reductase